MEVYGRPLGDDPVRDALSAERDGFDGVRVIDHFVVDHPGGRSRAPSHSLVSLGAAAAVTSRVKLTQTMMCTSFRHPAEVAQAVATLDRISAGRAEVGLGAGWYKPEHDSFGYHFGAPGERLGRLEEAATIVRTMLAQRGLVNHVGRYYRAVNDLEWPETPHVPEVLIGGSGPRLLALAARVADRVDVLHTVSSDAPLLDADHSNDVERLAARSATLRKQAADAGNSISVSATVFACLVPTEAEARQRRLELAPGMRSTPDLLSRDLLYVVGTPDSLLRSARLLAELGIDRIHLGSVPPHPQVTTDLILEILPSLRDISAAAA